VVWGAGTTFEVAVGAALGAVLLGFRVGVFSGYYSRFGAVLGDVTDIVLTFPLIPMVVLIASLFIATDLFVVSVLIALLWAPVARAVRTQATVVSKMPFIKAAKTSGYSDLETVVP